MYILDLRWLMRSLSFSPDFITTTALANDIIIFRVGNCDVVIELSREKGLLT